MSLSLDYPETFLDGVLHERWDPVVRKVLTYDTDGSTVVSTRDYTPEENTAADANSLYVTTTNNEMQLRKVSDLQGRLDRLAAYATDTEIVAALARTNSTAPTTAELNRLLKVMVRREARLTAALAMLIRLIDPALLTNISDTTDA